MTDATHLGRRHLIAMRWLALVVAFAACDKPPPAPAVGSATPIALADAELEPGIPDEQTVKALADRACPRVVAPYYFRVEKAGKVGHLLGTRHMGVSLAKLPATVRDELARAKLVVFETPPGDDGEVEHPSVSLPDALGPALWNKYTALVGLDKAMIVQSGPPSRAMLLMMVLFEDTSATLDAEIEQLVTSKAIPTGGLETSEFQDKLLDELLDLKMLRATIAGTASRATLEHETTDDLAEYCGGTDDDPGMDARTRAVLQHGGYSDAEIAALDDKLLDQRNRAWLPKLEELFAKDAVFVVVGADHLIGPRGVVVQLGRRGFVTARIR